ncbi:MAG: adenylate kinase [Clostridia bacterium]|nr:adenylate kinase [Clostridia bacterium]
MVILISGASHTGKTLLAQKMLDKYKYPYLSIDLLKMGLIRSGNTDLTPYDDDKLTPYLWGILQEIIKTAVENKQHLIIEGCYIPFDWKNSFEKEYLSQIKYVCLIMSKTYIHRHFNDIIKYANAIENRKNNSDFTAECAIQDNQYYYQNCTKYGLNYIWIDKEYPLEITLNLN